MAIPRNPPRRYTTSKQLIGGDDFNNVNDRACSFMQLIPTGGTQAAAAQVNAANVEIPAGSAAGGVLLPTSYPGAEVSILNNSGNTTTVYGTGADVVQTTGTTYAAAATGVPLVTLTSALYVCVKTGFWQRATTA